MSRLAVETGKRSRAPVLVQIFWHASVLVTNGFTLSLRLLFVVSLFLYVLCSRPMIVELHEIIILKSSAVIIRCKEIILNQLQIRGVFI